MSVTFSIRGVDVDFDAAGSFLDVSNVNARDLLAWLDVDHQDLQGAIAGSELAARCRRRLWPIPRNDDPPIADSTGRGAGGCRVICAGRDPGYLRDRTERLLALAEAAAEREVVFG